MDKTQCRMARAAFNLSTHELADLSGVGRVTIARFEAGENIREEKRIDLQKALEARGAHFAARTGRVGVTVPDNGPS